MRTSMTVGIHGIGCADSKVAEQAKAMAALGVIGTHHLPCRPCVVPWRPDGTESIACLQQQESAVDVQNLVKLSLNAPSPAFPSLQNG